MPTTISMPQLGESVAEGTIGRWLKQPGDRIQRDEPLVEIQTDKVNAEVPSPVAGFLQQILLPEGTTAAVKTELATHVRPEVWERQGNVFADTELMEATDIADAIAYIVTRPRRMAVNEMLIRPTEQER